ncbi:alpha/beta hydrolase [Uliginosibacterium sp. 31-12]|uniref:RBBP9/YdeN family alpha/beta hydrolase n=1 Tax=Uliginosibacterium sp. 31-12 TaxID=3062781 RepID=UPI0026E1C59F|nr:alpha/beta hydrolase [Uliginosibacterium sp. 31-12]MDO6385422.1 alpha/beta hydrolase [Uliginosibacterium sp. 31-12]
MSKILIVPGLHGSSPEHWQSWLETKLPGTQRIEQDDWATPHLPRWAGAIRHELDRAKGHVWIIAHSYGCLATALATTGYQNKVAGIMFVAPADPDKFDVASYLAHEKLAFPSVVVASSNDPWMRLTKAAYWADLWGARLINLGNAGHINVDSGFGAWQEGLDIFEQLRKTQSDLPLGTLDPDFRFDAGKKTPATRKSRQFNQRLQANWHRWLYGDEKPVV